MYADITFLNIFNVILYIIGRKGIKNMSVFKRGEICSVSYKKRCPDKYKYIGFQKTRTTNKFTFVFYILYKWIAAFKIIPWNALNFYVSVYPINYKVHNEIFITGLFIQWTICRQVKEKILTQTTKVVNKERSVNEIIVWSIETQHLLLLALVKWRQQGQLYSSACCLQLWEEII